MRVIHDLVCENDHIVKDVEVEVADGLHTTYGVCDLCGTRRIVSWAHGRAPATDVLGSEHFSDVLGVSFTSTRERDRKMSAMGFQPADNIRGGPMSQSSHLPKKLTPKGWEGRARFNPVEESG